MRDGAQALASYSRKARWREGQRCQWLGVGRGSRASPRHPYIRWWSRDPNKGRRRIKGGGAYCSGFRAGDQDLHQPVRGLCALERSGELQPPAAPKSFSLRLLQGDKSSRVAPVSAPPALLPPAPAAQPPAQLGQPR